MTDAGRGRGLLDGLEAAASAIPGAVPRTLRPRPALLPIAVAVWVAWSVPVVGTGVDRCSMAVACPGAVAAALGRALALGLPATYLVGAALTRLAERALRPAERLPAVFDPPRHVRSAVLLVVVAAGVLLVLAGYGALYTAAAAGLLALLYAPVLALLPLFAVQTSATGYAWGPGVAALWLGLYLVAVLAQVGWWYLLAHGATRLWRWR